MNTYFIIEIQEYADGSASFLPPLGFQVETEADEWTMISRFFTVCASAAEATCAKDTIKIVDSMGCLWKDEYEKVIIHGDV